MSVGETNDATWYLDSAAFAHMNPFEGNFLHTSSNNGCDRVLVGNGALLDINKIGYCQIPATSRPLHLHSTVHIPNLCHNLISIKRLCADNNCFVTFDSSSASIKDKVTGQPLLKDSSKSDVYPVSSSSAHSIARAVVALRQLGDI